MASTTFATSTTKNATSTKTKVFEDGKYTIVLEKVDPISTCSGSSCSSHNKKTTSSSVVPPPKPILIGMPCEAGEYPILVLLHGYLLYNSFYSQLIQHIASHGFIVIAPQLYTIAGPDSSEEIKCTAEITNWIAEGLPETLPSHVRPNLSKLALAGHSRGGKTAFALALAKSMTTTLQYSALIGIDPVDGMDKGKQTPPPVLTYVPRSFDINMAALVIGSGLGELKRNPLFPPCAPNGVNHRDFFKECRSPSCYFVVKDYGHLDMLDDDTKGIRGKSTYCLCKNGAAREPMRRFVGGVIVAFLKAYLFGDTCDLIAVQDGQTGPVELQHVEFIL